MSQDLEQQIQLEEEQSRISNQFHFSYSTFAKIAHQRKENLAISVRELNQQRITARLKLEKAQEKLSRLEHLKKRETVSVFNNRGNRADKITKPGVMTG